MNFSLRLAMFAAMALTGNHALRMEATALHGEQTVTYIPVTVRYEDGEQATFDIPNDLPLGQALTDRTGSHYDLTLSGFAGDVTYLTLQDIGLDRARRTAHRWSRMSEVRRR